MSITHIIYHLPGRKVGCTKDMDYRKQLYLEMDGSVPDIEIIEELHGATDQEAGDREWWWADHFGYPRRNHYTVIMNAVKERGRISRRVFMESTTPERRSEIASRGLANVPPERRIEIARAAGRIGGCRRVETTTPERRSEIGRLAAAAGAVKGGQAASEQRRNGAFKRGVCPHCGTENNVLVLGRFHLNRCPKRRIGFVRGN